MAAERVLGGATDSTGVSALCWAATPLQGAHRVLDLVCGSGALVTELPPGRWVGVDPAAAGPRRPAVRGTAQAVPLRADTVDAVCVLLALPLLGDLDTVFAEIRRVLRPGGTLVVLGPSRSVRTAAELGLSLSLRRVRRGRWPNNSALDHTGWLLAAADFAVLGDDRQSFTLPLPDGAAASRAVDDLHACGIWPPDLTPDARADLALRLGRRTGAGRVLPVPLRRVVGRR